MAKYRSGLTAYADGQVDPEQVLNPAIDRNWDAGQKKLSKSVGTGDVTLTRAEVQDNGYWEFTGAPGVARTVNVPDTDAANGWHGERRVAVKNSADADITFQFVTPGATVTVPVGGATLVQLENGNVRDIVRDITLLPDGSAATPALRFENDLDSGLYRIGANNLGLAVGGAKLLDFAAGALTLVDTGTGAGVGPQIILDRNSASPADSDQIGELLFRGRDSGGNATDYAGIGVTLTDVTDATEDAVLDFSTIVAGTKAERWHMGNGLFAEGQSDQGAGTVAVTANGLYFGGTQFGLGIANTWTTNQTINGDLQFSVGSDSLTIKGIEFPDVSTASATLQIHRDTNTSGNADFIVYAGDGSNTIEAQIQGGGGTKFGSPTGSLPGAGKTNAVEVQDDGSTLCLPIERALGRSFSADEWHALAPAGFNRLVDRDAAMVAKGWDGTAAGYVALMEADGAAPGLATKAEIEAATVTWTDDKGRQRTAKGKLSMTERMEHLWLAQDYTAIAVRDLHNRVAALEVA